MAPEDPAAIEAALERLLGDADHRGRAAEAAHELGDAYRWTTVLAPLVERVRSARRAAPISSIPGLAATIARGRDLSSPVGAATLANGAELGPCGEWRALQEKLARRVRRRP